ncbi:hydrogenase expression/formation protein HypE [candidate division KSB1 bacterium]|nr:hydrogenase expression/formation protein HypE [candidate division KSB1 bacterium]RQW05462.1 MAG: hydrogenase expression/formation protein HypE [candidate division KSB1 bacterium]
MNNKANFHLSCPIPISRYPRVTMAHGGGGRLSHQLIAEMFQPLFANEFSKAEHDGALLPTTSKNIAFTTDSHVIRPLFFPGGDIGSLAVYGTVNDLAMCGAKPLYLSLSLIIEEGLPMETLWRIAQSIKTAAETAGVRIVTGDTKVVNRATGDELFINTAGIGAIDHALAIQPSSIQSGDQIILNGDLGRHGIAVLAHREGLAFESEIESDCAPLNGIVQALLQARIPIHCLRDLTRGGLVSALVEIATTSGKRIELNEPAIPVREDIRGACEILGFDPLFVANEGRFIAFVPPDSAAAAIETMRAHPLGAGAVQIGQVTEGEARVLARNIFGGSRILDMFSGEQLPRIC